MSQSDDRARFTPTATLVTSSGMAVGLCLLAVVASAPRLLVLALPFIVHAVRALVNKPSPEARLVLPAVTTSATENTTIPVQAGIDGADALVALAWPGQPLTRRHPASGAAVDAGHATVGIELRRWGSHDLGVGLAVASDPSGAWQAEKDVVRGRVRVRPTNQPMAGGAGVRRPLGIQGTHLSARHGEGTELAEVREYRPGDRLRRITWPISSRRDELYVVDSFTERDTDVLIVLDTLEPARTLEIDTDSSLDIGARATLALARHYLDFGDRVGVHDLAGRLEIPLGSGPRQLVALHERLMHVPRRDGNLPPPLHPTPPIRSGSLVFFCTPLLGDKVLTELGRLRAMGADLVVVDTLPAGLGSRASHSEDVAQALGWRLRRIQRQGVIEALVRQGVPVAAWTGPTSLAGLLLAMEQAQHAPRVVVR